jgi:epoxyqueuosine reductase
VETSSLHELSQWIKSRSAELGFDACGITEAALLAKGRENLLDWLRMGFHGEMHYMARHASKRSDPRELIPGAKSVISFLKNYYPEEELSEENNFRISKYAYGRDYHFVIREKLHQLIKGLTVIAGEFNARAFTDSAPLLERAWAERAGLGRIGKNTCLIHPKLGSFVFIAEIITDLGLEYDHRQVNDLCGGCKRCIEACPTGALIAPYCLDARKCISYLTIEFREELPGEKRKNFNGWIFGCDICQDVCPWNRRAKPHKEPLFEPLPSLKKMTKEKWAQLTKGEFDEIFRQSAISRTQFEGLKRNIFFLKKEIL